ncbi:helix-turn-helix domain-containing protein [Okeania sp. KiyG1]|uniref:helix-turn-helix domain-containing protein n=1 Tax=Okeania sp. KiyG1 TaxID=2720165 RepID=UPI001F2DA630|nr:helix-turn-helix domain-containing protein [Okeania sp. KiyG1]
MGTAYQYKLRPNKKQLATIEMWLELLRRQYNYRLGERFSWWSENRCPVNACPKVDANSSTKRPSRLLLSKKRFSQYQRQISRI